MHTKVDFVAEAEAQQPFRDVKVGQELHLSRQEDGSWSCNRLDGSCICQVPTAAAASLSAAAQHHHHHQGGTSTAATAVIRSVKRCPDNPEAAVSLQVRISFSQAQGSAPLHQAPAPADDPSGFSLTTTELEQLAYNEDVRTTLGDKRLQEVLLSIDGAANREQALQRAMDNPDFREFADKMLHIMKPQQYPAPP